MNIIKRFFTTRAQGFNATRYFRLREKYYNSKSRLVRYIYVYMIKRIETKNGGYIGISNNNVFRGSRPRFIHGIKGVFISKESSLGDNCVIFQNVTIGRNAKGEAPFIGNNVLIGANSVIIGKVTIGNNVKIGAGCVVSIDIPDNSVVVMNHPRVLINKNPEESF